MFIKEVGKAFVQQCKSNFSSSFAAAPAAAAAAAAIELNIIYSVNNIKSATWLTYYQNIRH